MPAVPGADRRRRLKLGRLRLAVLRRGRHGVVDRRGARRDGERRRGGGAQRRNDGRHLRQVRRRRRRHAEQIGAAAGARRVREVQIELVVAVAERDLALLVRVVEAARRQRDAAARRHEAHRRAGDRRAAERVVDDAVRIDRQVQVLQIAARQHDDFGDALQVVREVGVRAAEQRRARAGAGPAEAQLVGVGRRVVRHDAAHAVDPVGRRASDVRQRIVQVQLDVPVGELDLVGVVNAVEVGVVPHAPIDQADAGDAADVDRHAGARLLRRIVPIDRSRVRHARTDGKIRVQRGAEPERHRATRRERPIDGRVVAREQGAGDDDAVRRAVERRRACDVGETARRSRRGRRGPRRCTPARRRCSSLARRTRASRPRAPGPPPTTATFFVMRNCCTLPTTTTVGSGPVAGLPSPSVGRRGSSAVKTAAWFVISVPRRHAVVDA